MRLEHETQLGHGLYNACGPACGAMVVNAFHPAERVTVRQVAQATGNDDGFSTFGGMIAAAASFAIGLEHKRAAQPMGWIAAALAARRLVIALIDYRKIEVKPIPYEYAHFVVVAELAGGLAYIHDPLRLTGPYAMPEAELAGALESPSKYPRRDAQGNRLLDGYNLPNQALVTNRPYPEGLEITARLRAILRGLQ